MKEKGKIRDSRRVICQMLSALHRMVSAILWPNETNFISQARLPLVQQPDLHCNEATRVDVPNKKRTTPWGM